MNLFKNNLIIDINNTKNLLNIDFKEDITWKFSIKISFKNGCTNANKIDVFFILKSFVENESSPVKFIFFTIDIKNNSFTNTITRKTLLTINIHKIKSLDSLEDFSEWWDASILFLWKYETEDSKADIIIILNKENIIQKFNLKNEMEIFFLKPIFPWKKKFFKRYIEKNKKIEDLKKALLKKLKKIK